MAYVKNFDPWAAGNSLTTSIMDNFETIYTSAASYLSSHTHDTSYYTKSEMESNFWYSGNDGTGSGSDADLIYKSTGNLHASSFSGLGVPAGLVVMWYGSIASIPSGWALCNGSGGTIDLRNRFVVGAGSTYSPGDTGGSTTITASGSISINGHTLTESEMGQHRHPFTDRYIGGSSTLTTGGYVAFLGLSSRSGTSNAAGGGGSHGHSAGEGTAFSGNAVTCMPYYYALAYIQKS